MTDGAAGRGWRARVGFDAPVDIAWLAAFRVLFGLTLAVSMARFIAYGWIDEFFTRPTFHFKYWGFAWVEVLPPEAMHALFWALGGLSLMVAAGLLFRVSALLLVVGFTYLQLIDVTTYLNHYYLASLLALLLACSPAHRAWSLDARLRPAIRRDRVAGYVHLLFRFQVGVVYTYAGLAKAHGDWLLHAQPLRIWLSSHTDMPVLGPLFTYEWTAILMSWGGFLFDTSVPWFLLWKRTRPYAYAVLVVFHLMVGKLFPIGMFPIIMMVAATVFFAADWPRWRKATLHADVQPMPRFALPLLGVYCAVQLLLPMRFLAYGGDVRWHEQGMRFSWRVMVREKNGSVEYLVRSKQTGHRWQVSPRRYLTFVQERELSGQPDLILQLAHHVAHDFAQRGLGPVEVRVDAQASLNGRPSAPLIDPNVDLTTVEDGVTQASWILPAPAQAPPPLRPI
ncbi:MAG: HTTM domain-containing protein [Polyangiales bacterium]